MNARLQMGDGQCGLTFMKFTLTYDGPLKSNGRPGHKWAIRKKLSPQLNELWRVSPAMQHVASVRWYPLTPGFHASEIHHSSNDPGNAGGPAPPSPMGSWIDILEPIQIKGHTFIPLIRDSLALHCGLKIIYLRKEEPGRLIYQSGDLDNRLKTLFDALSVPDNDQVQDDDEAPNPMHCLLENDRLISGINVETGRLLDDKADKADVRLIIEVDVRVSLAKTYNHAFLGG